MFFNASYDRSDFLRILQTKICPNFVQEIKPMQFERQTKYFVKDSMYQLGKIKFADDTEVIVMEIQQTSISDPRITLTKDAFKILHDHQKDNALIVFYSADTDSWRLSLLTSKYEGRDKINSNAKRYSFLLGSHEKVKTPNDYLIKNPKGIVKDLNDLISRFDVEVVRKEFFKQYLNLFLELYKELKPYEIMLGKDNDLVTFTKTLMGKIIFLYFIQKKGRLGVHIEKEWGEGRKDFMKFLLDDYKGPRDLHKGEHKSSFYNDYLEPLFYEALSNERNTDVYERFDLKIPYLNGGLFEQEYDRKNTFINPKDEIFEKIIDTFDRYNFTIHEDDPYDREIAVDPEMLGKIFETMISVSKDNIEEICDIYEKAKAKSKDPDKIISVDVGKELNKKFGAFYTPREIVHYMTKESLTYYLINGIKEARPNESDEQIEKIIRELFRLKDDHLLKEETKLSQEEFQLFEQYIILTNDLLKKIKVLDPAVGSGAFPMGILHEIFGLRRYLIDAFELKFESDYEIKKSIIQNNIYGVDIEQGAIDIARLRFWLSLVVDADKPEPLPNLDFKFVCANTLIPLEGGSLFTKQDLIDELNNLRKKYFGTQKKSEKELLKKEFYKAQQELCGFTVKQHFNNRKEQKEYIEVLVKQNTDPRNRQIMQWDPFDTKESSEFFDSELMFGIDGFSICIGNPPYISYYSRQSHGNDKTSDIIETFKKSYNFIEDKKKLGRFNTVMFFLEMALNLTGNQGIINFIIDTNFYSNPFENIRKYLLENSSIIEIVSNVNAFEGVGSYQVILKYTKKMNKENFIKWKSIQDGEFIYNGSVQQKKYLKTLEIIPPVSEGLDVLRDKIEKNGQIKDLLGNNNIRTCITFTGQKDKFVIPKPELEIDYPLLEGSKSVQGPYLPIKNDFFVRYDLKLRDKLNEDYIQLAKAEGKRTPMVIGLGDLECFKSPKIFVRLSDSRITATYTDQFVCADLSLYVIVMPNKQNIWNNYSIFFLLGILNSKLITFYARKFEKIKNLGRGTPQIRLKDIRELPIVNIDFLNNNSITLHNNIRDIAKSILAIKKGDPKADISQLEKEIDQIVYKLYGLTDEEIKIVEESTVG
ncbi:MAG: TaqI-like C-terminal specificity domain-containing protein [Candidatus Absconditabacterales bacterium]